MTCEIYIGIVTTTRAYYSRHHLTLSIDATRSIVMDVEEFFNMSIRFNSTRQVTTNNNNKNNNDSCWPIGCVYSSTTTDVTITTSTTNGSIILYDVIDDHVSSDKPPKEYWALLMIILPLLAIFGNILVIISVYKEKSLQSVTNYFIVSLAVADMFVGGFVMPFAVYFLVNVDWELSETICDFWIAIDVTLSTASILNLVAISIDRFMAVTRPIKYAKHKSNNRVMFTIAIVWIISIAIGSPIVLGLNIFYNSDFIIYSSLGSFYIPCVLMVFLYYRIFKAIHERAKRPIGSSKGHHTSHSASRPTKTELRKIESNNGTGGGGSGGGGVGGGIGRSTTPSGDASQIVIIENVRSSRKSSEDTIDRSVRSPIPIVSGSVAISSPDLEVHEEDDEDDDDDDEESEAENAVECKVIENIAAADLERCLHSTTTTRISRAGSTFNGNPDSGYDPSHVEETQFCLIRNPHIKDDVTVPTATDERDSIGNDVKVKTSSSVSSKNSKQQQQQQKQRQQQDQHQQQRKRSPDDEQYDDDEDDDEEGDDSPQDEGRASTSASPTPVIPKSSTSSGSASAATPKPPVTSSKNVTSSSVNGTTTIDDQKKKRLRFYLRRKTTLTKDGKKKKEKPSAKRERKATKTLAIVLGVFLFCWVPFFTCNIIDAICIKLEKPDCRLSTTAFLLTTWLGYINSIVNPVIYTIFNPEFRKAFKKILGFKS